MQPNVHFFRPSCYRQDALNLSRVVGPWLIGVLNARWFFYFVVVSIIALKGWWKNKRFMLTAPISYLQLATSEFWTDHASSFKYRNWSVEAVQHGAFDAIQPNFPSDLKSSSVLYRAHTISCAQGNSVRPWKQGWFVLKNGETTTTQQRQ